MPEHYWMVVTSIIASFLVIVGLLLFRRFYPKKKINYYYLLIILSLLPCISIFRPGAYESGDFVYHLYRAMAFADALKDGIVFPSWAASLNSGYGYPVFIFIYVIPYYLISLLSFTGLSFVLSEKLILAAAYILSGLFMFVVLKKLTKNDLAAFTGAIVYLYSPYHLVDLHFRVSIAEVIAFTLAPAVFYLILKLEEKTKLIYVLWLGFLFGIFFLTHPAQFIFYSGIFFLYILYQLFRNKRKNYSLLLTVSLAFVVGLAISSFAWIARFTLTKITLGSLLAQTPVIYVQPWEMLYAPWRLGFLFQGSYGELSYVIGYTQILLVLFCAFVLIKKIVQKDIQKQLQFWFFLTIFLIFCMTAYSKFIWDIFPLLNLMQFSYRLLHPLIFCMAVVAAYLTLHYQKKKIIIFTFVFLTIGYTILNWGNRGMESHINDNWIKKNLVYTALGEAMFEAQPLWWDSPSRFDTSNIPKVPIAVLEGPAEVKQRERTTTYHRYIVYSPQGAMLLENTLYFPGWTVNIDSKPVPINYLSKEHKAKIVFIVPKGLHEIEVSYTDIPALCYAKAVSFTVILLIVLYSLYYIIKQFIWSKKAKQK